MAQAVGSRAHDRAATGTHTHRSQVNSPSNTSATDVRGLGSHTRWRSYDHWHRQKVTGRTHVTGQGRAPVHFPQLSHTALLLSHVSLAPPL